MTRLAKPYIIPEWLQRRIVEDRADAARETADIAALRAQWETEAQP
jgi:hypothetical protein